MDGWRATFSEGGFYIRVQASDLSGVALMKPSVLLCFLFSFQMDWKSFASSSVRHKNCAVAIRGAFNVIIKPHAEIYPNDVRRFDWLSHFLSGELKLVTALSLAAVALSQNLSDQIHGCF